MSEKKINIDLGLFDFAKNKTRKKKSEDKSEGIKIKQPSQKKKNETIKKKSILKMIRQHQEERYNKLFDEKKNNKKPDEAQRDANKEFDEAQKFMQNLTEKTVMNSSIKNKSIKQYPTTTNSLLYHPSVDTFSDIIPNDKIKEVSNSIVQGSIAPSQITLNPAFPKHMNHIPQYGCLKNGQLPTYRNYMNQTRKAMPQITIGGGNTQTVSQQPTSQTELRNELIEKRINESMNRVNEMKNASIKLEQLRENNKPKKFKRKKTVRRTYKVGKSKIHPKVSVLVSNKTIRNNISTKSQLLKQTPIEEVKKHLINHGLIKIGTIAPNDVLRKMYESSILMCGELNNHNPDNLLFNFVHGAKH